MSKPKDNNLPKRYKIVLLGDTGVGKTSIFNRYCKNKFESNYNSTIGVDFEVKKIEYKKKDYSIEIFDIAGQERFQSIIDSYFRMGQGFFVIFDLTNKHSLDSLPKWIKKIKEKIEEPKYIILGNKDDLKNDQLNDDEIYGVLNELENFNDNNFYRVSAKEGKNIKNVFNRMINFLENNNVGEDKTTFIIGKGENKFKSRGNVKCC